MSYLRTHICHVATVGGLALTTFCVFMAVLSTEHWPMMVWAFLAGGSFANALYIVDAIRMRKRIRALIDAGDRMQQAGTALSHALMNDGWDSTEEQPRGSEYDRWMH
jgi:hypothetical protein